MAEPKPDHVYTENLRVLEKIMGVMFNNIKFSDTVFTVKEQKYYALSQLLAASSETMNTLISTHYEHCQDRDIKLYDIRNEESFMIILQYIYGMNINFSQMNITVMCEVLTLSEKYNLDDFFKDLKCFLSKMDCFQLDSVVSLLNTASKYNISELYKRVTVFAYENTEELVKHETFQDLQYNVLVDLIKSDWFCCSEIDILTGVLTWHTDMYDENKKKKKTIQNENIANEDHNYYASNDKMDVSAGTGLADVQEETMNIEDSDLNGEDKSLNADYSKEMIQSTMSEKCKETVKSFCENVLKSLLGHIRVSEISAKVWMTSYNTDWFKKYSDYLQNVDNFCQSSKPRQKYEEPVTKRQKVTYVEANDEDEQELGNDDNINVLNNPISSNDESVQRTDQLDEHLYEEIKNITKTFTIHYDLYNDYDDAPFASDEVYVLGGVEWRLYMQVNESHYIMDLPCFDINDWNDWKFTVKCQLKWLSHDINIPDIVFDETCFEIVNDGHSIHTNTCIGERNISRKETSSNWWNAMAPDNIYTFEVHFISLKKHM